MKVLVTGRNGQLVRSLFERSEGSGIIFRSAGRPELDLETPGSAARLIASERPDAIVNAAAYTAVDQAEDEPERAQRVNGDAAGEIAAAAAEIGARIIHISTDYVFDGRKVGAYVPYDPTGPLGVYGRTKLDGERQVRAAAPSAVIVRTAWVYSPFGRNFVKTMMNLADTGAEIKVVANQCGSPTSALDLADGLLTVLRGWTAGGGAGVGKTYHLAGSGAEPSWFDVADLVLAEYRRLGGPKAKVLPIRTEDRPTKAERPRNCVLDSSSFEDVFGYVMPDWETSAAATVKRLAESISG